MQRRHPVPSEGELRSLLRRIVGSAQLKGKGKESALLSFLFERAIGSDFRPMTVSEIVKACSSCSQTEGALHEALKRLRRLLAEFFDERREGESKEEIRVEIEPQAHRLLFIRNEAERPCTEEFWEPYFRTVKPTLIYYPEPQFFRHRHNTYIRDLGINWPHQHGIEKRLSDVSGAGGAIPSTSYVPSGLVAAIILLFQCFSRHDASLHTDVANYGTERLSANNGNAIIVATPTTNFPLIRMLDKDCPARSVVKEDFANGALRNEIAVARKGMRNPKSYVDQTQEEDTPSAEDVLLHKWALVTRRVQEPGVVRMSVVGHSRSVQGVIRFLTDEDSLAQLKLRFKGKIPPNFQAIFGVRMRKRWGELDITDVAIEQTFM